MTTADKAIRQVLKHEGGYVNDPNDPGGETKFGITKWDHPLLDIEWLTLEDAVAIYRVDWWDRFPAFEGVAAASERLAIKLFDAAVNMGMTHASRALQRALRASELSVIDDGIIGTRTLLALDKLSGPGGPGDVCLLPAFRSELAARYRVLIARNGKLKRFKGGWLARAYS